MSKILTFETDSQNKCLEIHTNKEGLKELIDHLTFLYDQNKRDHDHLMTPSWGGEELSEDKQNFDSIIFNHVKIIYWD